MTTLSTAIAKLNACPEAVEWLESLGNVSIQQAYQQCTRADRLVWLLDRLDAWDDRTRRLFACDCAHRALTRERDAGREPDPRSWKAVEVAQAFAEGRASTEELRTAAKAAARDAAWDAWAARAAWDAAKAAWTAAAWTAEHQAQCNWIRQHVPCPEVSK